MGTPPLLSRRRFLQLAGGAAAVFPAVLAAKPARPLSLGISLFGCRTLDEGLRVCAEAGYENIEIHTGPGPTEPKSLSPQARKEFRRRLESLGLTVSGLSLHSSELGSDGAAHAANLEAIKEAAQLGHDLSPDGPAPIQAGSNGRSADWDTGPEKYADRLADWAKTAAAAGATLALKAHAAHAVDTPDKLLWLMRRVHHPALSVNYDYSHFEFGGFTLADSLTRLMPFTTFVQVKDARMDAGHLRYLLPGEGDIDYADYFRLLRKLGYSGPVVVEISVQVVRRPGFEFRPAARSSFAAVAAGRSSP